MHEATCLKFEFKIIKFKLFYTSLFMRSIVSRCRFYELKKIMGATKAERNVNIGRDAHS